MKHYLVATQRPWGVKTFHRVAGTSKKWMLHDHQLGLKDSIQAMKPRYVFFLNWSGYVPPDVLTMAECVNMHCTPLPYGRGGGPIENLIQRGHTETVITAHRMVEELDAGPIYGTGGPVSLAGTKEDILDRFVAPCSELIRWIIETEPEPLEQVGKAVTFKRLPKAEFETFWAERV
jgi:methionyl-tRNA formyltransferase